MKKMHYLQLETLLAVRAILTTKCSNQHPFSLFTNLHIVLIYHMRFDNA